MNYICCFCSACTPSSDSARLIFPEQLSLLTLLCCSLSASTIQSLCRFCCVCHLLFFLLEELSLISLLLLCRHTTAPHPPVRKKLLTCPAPVKNLSTYAMSMLPSTSFDVPSIFAPDDVPDPFAVYAALHPALSPVLTATPMESLQHLLSSTPSVFLMCPTNVAVNIPE